MTFSGLSDRGWVRTENEDSYGKFPEDNHDLTHPAGQLFVVADGMGGHLGGREASSIAVKTVQETFFRNPQQDVAERLRHAFEAANSQILTSASQDPHLFGMGTTCTALVLQVDRVCVAHVGDSRAYRINSSTIERLTRDHSHVEDLRRQGILTEKEAREHPSRSILNRALGSEDTIEIDILEDISLESGDHFLLCTDGLAKVEREELEEIVLKYSPETACKKLIQLANDRGGEDNVTVQIVRIDAAQS